MNKIEPNPKTIGAAIEFLKAATGKTPTNDSFFFGQHRHTVSLNHESPKTFRVHKGEGTIKEIDNFFSNFASIDHAISIMYNALTDEPIDFDNDGIFKTISKNGDIKCQKLQKDGTLGAPFKEYNICE